LRKNTVLNIPLLNRRIAARRDKDGIAGFIGTIILDIFDYTIRHGIIPNNMNEIRQGLNDCHIPEKEE